MVHGLVKASLKSDREIMHHFTNFFKIEKEPIQECFQPLLSQFAFYLTKFENESGRSLESPFFIVAPEPYVKTKSNFKFMLVLDLD
jgi:hypothetical protein